MGSADKVAPKHIGATALKVGVRIGSTIMVSVGEVAHWPTSGVKV